MVKRGFNTDLVFLAEHSLHVHVQNIPVIPFSMIRGDMLLLECVSSDTDKHDVHIVL
jgi:hypothetical protein